MGSGDVANVTITCLSIYHRICPSDVMISV